MNHLIKIAFFLTLSGIASAQKSRELIIINKHFNASTKTSWEHFKTFYEKGSGTHSDSTVEYWEHYMEGSQKIKWLFWDHKKEVKSVGQNEHEVWRTVEGQIVKVPKIFTSSPSTFNFSYAISKGRREGVHFSYLKDTLVERSNFHLFRMIESGDDNEKLIYINSTNYLIERIEYEGKGNQIVILSDYRWVNEFLIAFTETIYINGEFNYQKKTDVIDVNIRFSEDTFTQDR